MIFLLFKICLSRNPVIIIPGIIGSMLKGSVAKPSSNWYCPSNINESTLWLKKQYSVHPLLDCLLEWLTLEYDNVSKVIRQPKGVNAEIHNFGTLDGLTHRTDNWVGINFLPFWNEIIHELEKKGWNESISLFSAPYDWRMGISELQYLWKDLTKLVEDSYTKNDNEPVIFLSHSYGSYLLHQFLTKHTNAKWRKKYVSKAVFVAPTWGGSSMAFTLLYKKLVPFTKLKSTASLAKFIESTPSLYQHLPNYKVFKNDTLAIGPNGEKYTAADLPRLLLEQKKIPVEFIEVFNKTLVYLNEKPVAIDVNSAIFYNSGLRMVKGMKFEDWDQEESWINGDGDFLVNAEGAEYACEKWKKKQKAIVYCKDIDSTNMNYNHIQFIATSKVINAVTGYVFGKNTREL